MIRKGTVASLLFCFFALTIANAEESTCAKNITLKSDPQLIIDSLKCLDSATQKTNLNKGLVAFFNLRSCPIGWREFSDVHGRYIVGIGPKGALGKTVGKELRDSEERIVGKHIHPISPAKEHSHTISGAGSHTHGIHRTNNAPKGSGVYVDIGSMGSPNNESHANGLSTSPNHTHALSSAGDHTHETTSSGEVNGTNAPYIQLLACEKE